MDKGLTVTSSITYAVVAAATAPSGDICDGLNPIDMHVQQVNAKLRFPGSLHKDSLALKTILQLKDGFNPDGQVVLWEIAGINGTITLNAKGASPKSTTTKVSLRFKKPKKGQPFLITRFAKGTCGSQGRVIGCASLNGSLSALSAGEQGPGCAGVDSMRAPAHEFGQNFNLRHEGHEDGALMFPDRDGAGLLWADIGTARTAAKAKLK